MDPLWSAPNDVLLRRAKWQKDIIYYLVSGRHYYHMKHLLVPAFAAVGQTVYTYSETVYQLWIVSLSSVCVLPWVLCINNIFHLNRSLGKVSRLVA